MAKWEPYIQAAPDGYFSSEVFAESFPVMVTARVGQNKVVANGPPNPNEIDEFEKGWANLRDPAKLRYTTFALATHFRYVTFYSAQLAGSFVL